MNRANGVPEPFPRLPGVIDTLSSGYRLLNRHLYLLLVPLALDLFYWLGPRLSVEPLMRQLAQTLDQAVVETPAGAQTTQVMQSLPTLVESLGKDVNLFTALSGTLAVPSLPAGQIVQRPGWLGPETVMAIATPAGLAAATLLLSLLGIVAGSLYMSMAAQIVRGGELHPASLGRQVVAGAGRVLLLACVLVLVALVVGAPVIVMLSLAAVLIPVLGAFLLFGLWSVILALAVFLFFTVSAIFLSEVGPLRAVFSSITIVRLFTSSALRMFLVTMLISLGMPYVWNSLGSSDAATLVSMLGNAFIGVGLTLACLIFYSDRMKAIMAQETEASSQQV